MDSKKITLYWGFTLLATTQKSIILALWRLIMIKKPITSFKCTIFQGCPVSPSFFVYRSLRVLKEAEKWLWGHCNSGQSLACVAWRQWNKLLRKDTTIWFAIIEQRPGFNQQSGRPQLLGMRTLRWISVRSDLARQLRRHEHR